MDFLRYPAACADCGELLSFDANACLLCGRFFCRQHIVVRKGVATCGGCAGERLARESSGVVSDADEDRVVALIRRDFEATIGAGAEHIARAAAAHLRLYVDSLADYEQRVVDDVQQRVHDEFLDTSWPRCPVHPHHPLWFSEGWWRCESAGAIARLGELGGASS